MIGGNGCYVESEGEVVMHQLITAEQCRHIVDWLHARGLEFYLESNNGLFASERFREEAGPVMRLYAKGKGAAIAICCSKLPRASTTIATRETIANTIRNGVTNLRSSKLTSRRNAEDALWTLRMTPPHLIKSFFGSHLRLSLGENAVP